MLLVVLRIFGNYAEIMLVSLNYASYHQNYATWFLSKIKIERANNDKTRNKPLSSDCRLVVNSVSYISSAFILQNQQNTHLFWKHCDF